MPSLAKHESSDITKLLIIGNSGVGKTGSLVSLVAAGYKLRVLDFDNGLDVLAQFVRKQCPDKIGNVEYRTLTDKLKGSPMGPILDGPAKAFVEGLKMLDNWRYTADDGSVVDLGKPAQWGPESVLVIDSLTFMARAAYDWGEPLTPRGQGGKPDGRAVYGTAMKAIEKVLAQLHGKEFNTNVIVLSHIRYQQMDDGTTRGWPTAIGEALGPTICQYFNSLALCERQGEKRTLRTASSALIDLKNPASFKMSATLPLETGLADFFKALRS